VTSTPHVELPSREDLKRAIRPWWSGGGTAEILIDVLRGSAATLSEAEQLATKVAERVDRGYRYVSRDVAEEQLELIRAASAYRTNKVAAASQEEDSERNIGSPAWFAKANRRAQESWERFFPGEKHPPANPGQHYSDEADERYRALIRSQREAIRNNVGKKQRRRWE
jgi:hypothetical protein